MADPATFLYEEDDFSRLVEAFIYDTIDESEYQTNLFGELSQGDELYFPERQDKRKSTSPPQPLSSDPGVNRSDGSEGNHQNDVDSSSSSSLSVGPKQCKIDITCPAKVARTYQKFTPAEVEMLITAVEKTERRSWKLIKLYYFKDSARKREHLKEKWRQMLNSADAQTNPQLNKLYSRAKEIDARLPKCSCSKSLRN